MASKTRAARDSGDSLTAALAALTDALKLERVITLEQANREGYVTLRQLAQHTGQAYSGMHKHTAGLERVKLAGRQGYAYRARRAG